MGRTSHRLANFIAGDRDLAQEQCRDGFDFAPVRRQHAAGELLTSTSRCARVRRAEGQRQDGGCLAIIERAVRNGKTEVEFIRFPVEICTDRGRAINQQERGWEGTLTGLPKELYGAWAKYFRPRGYKLRAEIVQFTGDRPSDIGMTLSWN